MSKRVLRITVCAAAMLILSIAACGMAFAAGTQYYNLYVGGVQVSSDNASAIQGNGISGKISYNAETNTLTLDNAVITSAGFAYFENGGYPVCAIGYGGSDRLTINLKGSSSIQDLTAPANNPNDRNYNISTKGMTGIGAIGPVSIKGKGSLRIADAMVGVGVSCSDLSVRTGSSLQVDMSFEKRSDAVLADSVAVNGKLTTSNQTVSTTGFGLKTQTVKVGKTGEISAAVRTETGTTSVGIYLLPGGSATIGGKVRLSAKGGEGQKAGIGMWGEEQDTPVRFKDKGRLTSTGNYSGIYNIKIVTKKGVTMRTGPKSSSAVNMTPNKWLPLERYVVAGMNIKPKIKAPKLGSKSVRAGEEMMTVRWKALSKYYVNGYQFRYSRKANMSKATKVNVKGAETEAYDVGDLKTGKKYYVQLRAYKKIDGKKVWSAWSKKRAVKIK